MDTALQPTYKLRQSIADATLEDIAYPDLWHLFRIGDIVTRGDASHQAFKVLGIAGGEPLTTKMRLEEQQSPPIYGFAIDCMSVSYDGSFYVPRLHKFKISKFTGLKKIPALEVYPIHFDPDASAIKNQLMSNAARYISLTRRPYSHVMFRGRTVDDTPEEIEGQVVIDVAMALRTEPDWRPPPIVNEEHLTKPDLRETFLAQACRHKGLNSEGCCGGDIAFKDQNMNIDQRNPKLKAFMEFMRPRTEGELGDDLMLLPNSIYSFVLRLRKWVTVQTRDLSDVAFDNDFNHLMMNEKQKQAILALVETHEKARLSPGAKKHSIGASLDLVTGKGTGLILLLHGEPGVGKTSTAECVADRTKRPLFPITCGDIGEAAMEVERNLQHNFRLAHRWGCVLLLEESDIFLAKRNKTDLRRNAVTSVFLRSLDYYAGILFLTTNRVGGIDPAFKSRIHLSVFYPRLDLDRTQKLFDVFLHKTKEEQRKSGVSTFDIKSKEISRFAKSNYRSLKKSGFSTWNGRQIRNAFQTAIALVEYDVSQMQPGDPKPSLGKKQFEVVAEGSRQFDDYLMRTLQGRDADIAIRDQWRDDTFELQEPGHATPLRSELPTTRKPEPRFRSAKDELSVTESDSESDSEESGNDEEKTGDPKSSGGNDMEEYQQFLEFQAMKKAMGK
uniref:AAA+ ATPase domain-containing protein n=1 Tax=Bionectria ochroleuca TaxID=29856 RepID=A0A8H7N1J9_BIOOC